MSTVAQAPVGADRGDSDSASPPAASSTRLTDALLALAVAGAIVAVVFVTRGGVDETGATAQNTWTDVVVTLLGGVATAAALIVWRPGRRHGAVAVTAMAALTAWEAASISWAALPDSAWLAVNQALAYLFVFAGAAATARIAPARWRALLAGVAIAVTAVCAWSLLAKVFPATLASSNTFGRLQAPFGYWNAVGVMAAIGVPCLLWLSARRGEGRILAGLCAPALTLVAAVLVLCYSRSADLAAVICLVLWIAFVPLRLRAVAMLVPGMLGGAVISVWALTHHALSDNGVAMSAQDTAGHTFGVVVLVVVVLVAAVGVLVATLMDREGLTTGAQRRTAGRLVGAGVVAIVLIALVVVALSPRGLVGEIRHGVDQLTSTSLTSTNTAGRVLAFGSSRPTYWREAIAVGDHALLKGAGEVGFAAARQRYTTNPTIVQQAHSYVFETFADLGIVGLVLTFALLLGWVLAARRPLAPRVRWRDLPGTARAEREAMITLAILVVGFGIQSTLDWTWYFAGIAVPVLACAGWLAGRGPLLALRAADTSPRRPSLLDRPAAAVALPLLLGVVLGGMWMQWRPLRSAQQLNAAESTADGDRVVADARGALSSDPLALYPRLLLSSVYADAHRPAQARAELVRATQIQPQNPLPWEALGQYDLGAHRYRDAELDATRILALDHTDDKAHYVAVSLHIEAAAGAAASGTVKTG